MAVVVTILLLFSAMCAHAEASALSVESVDLLDTADASGATDAAPSGVEIMQAEWRASHGYGHYAAAVEMLLVSKKGRTVERALRIKQLETSAGAVKTLVTFDLPKSIRGTGLLTHSHHGADDDQWLFLPALKRVKKIASRDRSGAFVGSTFSYEDLADYAVDEFDLRWLRREACGELTCDVVERVARYPFSGYTRQEVWVDDALHRIRRVEYSDDLGRPLKTLLVADYREYVVGEGTIWQPHELTMSNTQNGRKTVLRFSGYDFDAPLEELRDFSTNALRRVR